jgi:hypothetical protein
VPCYRFGKDKAKLSSYRWKRYDDVAMAEIKKVKAMLLCYIIGKNKAFITMSDAVLL